VSLPRLLAHERDAAIARAEAAEARVKDAEAHLDDAAHLIASVWDVVGRAEELTTPAESARILLTRAEAAEARVRELEAEVASYKEDEEIATQRAVRDRADSGFTTGATSLLRACAKEARCGEEGALATDGTREERQLMTWTKLRERRHGRLWFGEKPNERWSITDPESAILTDAMQRLRYGRLDASAEQEHKALRDDIYTVLSAAEDYLFLTTYGLGVKHVVRKLRAIWHALREARKEGESNV
jgi:hypothetical protein